MARAAYAQRPARRVSRRLHLVGVAHGDGLVLSPGAGDLQVTATASPLAATLMSFYRILPIHL